MVCYELCLSALLGVQGDDLWSVTCLDDLGLMMFMGRDSFRCAIPSKGLLFSLIQNFNRFSNFYSVRL
jgi:hypothetical protein